MNRNFPNTFDGDMIKCPVLFEPTVDTLNGDSAVIQEFPLRRFKGAVPLIVLVRLDDGLTSVLPVDMLPQFSTGISSVG